MKNITNLTNKTTLLKKCFLQIFEYMNVKIQKIIVTKCI